MYVLSFLKLLPCYLLISYLGQLVFYIILHVSLLPDFITFLYAFRYNHYEHKGIVDCWADDPGNLHSNAPSLLAPKWPINLLIQLSLYYLSSFFHPLGIPSFLFYILIPFPLSSVYSCFSSLIWFGNPAPITSWWKCSERTFL